MTTDADRAKAAELLGQYWEKAVPDWAAEEVAAALADARAEADQLRDAMRALAEDLDVRARAIAEEADSVTIGEARRFGMLGRILGMKAAAARVRDLADGGRR